MPRILSRCFFQGLEWSFKLNHNGPIVHYVQIVFIFYYSQQQNILSREKLFHGQCEKNNSKFYFEKIVSITQVVYH